jgi:hypothetical protein
MLEHSVRASDIDPPGSAWKSLDSVVLYASNGSTSHYAKVGSTEIWLKVGVYK